MRSAHLIPSSFNAENNTIRIRFATEQAALKTDPRTGRRYREVLPLAGMDTSRLSRGIHFIKDHGLRSDGFTAMLGPSVDDVLGSTIPGTEAVRPGDAVDPQGYAEVDVRLSTNPDHAGLIGDIRSGVIVEVSYLYDKNGDPEIRKGADGIEERIWRSHTPKEISAVAISANHNAGFRSAEVVEPKEETMNEPTPKPEVPANDPAPVGVVPVAREVDLSARNAEIRNLGLRAGCSAELINNLCDKSATTIEAARAAIQADWFERNTAEPIVPNAKARTDYGVDEADKVRSAMCDALGRRTAPHLFKGEAAPGSSDFMGMRLSDMLRFLAKRNGARGVDSMNEAQLVDHIFDGARSGTSIALGHTTGDFTAITSQLAGLTVARQYAAENPLYRLIAERRMAPNFLAQTEIDFGTTDVIEAVGEAGEIKLGKFTEGSNTWAVASFGKRYPFTRKLIINSRIDLLTAVPMKMVKKIVTFEQNLMMGLVIDNGLMGDGKAWFHADHKNLAASGADPDVTSMDEGFKAMALQLDIDGVPMNLVPRYALCGHGKRAKFAQFLGQFNATQPSNVRPDYMGEIQIVPEGRIDASNEPNAWYLFADPATHAALVYSYLEGYEAPRVSTMPGWEVQGLEFKIEHDFGGSKVSNSGVWKNEGDSGN